MRTTLSAEGVAYEQGFSAFEDGIHRTANPYTEAELRAAWFNGWDRAKECAGTCNG